MTNLENLFKAHLDQRMKDTDKALSALNYQSVVFSSGTPFTYFEDDNDAPFSTNPHFAHWCPAKGPHHFIKYETGKKPLLVYYSPNDFWHLHEQLGNPFWANCFDIVEVDSLEKLWPALGSLTQCVLIGNETKYAVANSIKVNCELLTARLNWYRRFKSEYEIHCLSEANRIASIAHLAAKESFLNGSSEYEIHMSYLASIQAVDTDLPYTGIVALDKNGAILHYHGRDHKKNGQVLLIDSGAKFSHYGSDITRTYTTKNCNSVFSQLLLDVEDMQQELCSKIKPGIDYPDLHEQCLLKTASILEKNGIINMKGDFETAVNEGMIKPFFPHGLGHFLGIQVHDIGGKQLDEQGNPITGKSSYRSLRFMGTLQEGNVVTVEPGIYFIPSLLNPFKETHKYANCVNWKLIEELIPFGGIRIEDDVVATKNGPQNLTRKYLPN